MKQKEVVNHIFRVFVISSFVVIEKFVKDSCLFVVSAFEVCLHNGIALMVQRDAGPLNSN